MRYCLYRIRNGFREYLTDHQPEPTYSTIKANSMIFDAHEAIVTCHWLRSTDKENLYDYFIDKVDK